MFGTTIHSWNSNMNQDFPWNNIFLNEHCVNSGLWINMGLCLEVWWTFWEWVCIGFVLTGLWQHCSRSFTSRKTKHVACEYSTGLSLNKNPILGVLPLIPFCGVKIITHFLLEQSPCFGFIRPVVVACVYMIYIPWSMNTYVYLPINIYKYSIQKVYLWNGYLMIPTNSLSKYSISAHQKTSGTCGYWSRRRL